MRKNLQIGCITVIFMFSLSSIVFAGEWKKDNVGWWYDNGDGNYSANMWQWIDGNNDGMAECYYFDRAGYCLTNTLTTDGYVVNENGAWIVDGVVQTMRISEPIELSDYLYEKNVYNVANNIGEMFITQTNQFKQCAIGDKLTIGILADSISSYRLEPEVYDFITDIINYGNQKVTLFNVMIGDDFETGRVDMPLTEHIPHGTGRAALPHPALCKADCSAVIKRRY